MIKKCIQILMKDLNFKHLIDDSETTAQLVEKFIRNLEKIRKKGGYLILENHPDFAVIKPSEINAIYFSEIKPEILPKEEPAAQ